MNESRRESIWNRDIQFASKGLSSRFRESLYRELQLMLDAGIELRAALNIFQTGITKKGTRQLFEKLEQSVVEGSSLASAMQQTNRFSNYEFQSIRIGEETGTLKKVTQQLADHYKSREEQRKQLISALSYPILVLMTSIGAVGFMLQFVVPMFEDVFKRLGSELPWMTKVVIGISRWFAANAIFGFAGVLAIALFIWVSRNERWFQKHSSSLVLQIPFFGEIIRFSRLAKFTSAMYLLISAHHPLVQSIVMLREMINFYPIRHSLEMAEDQLIQGADLSATLKDHSIYPPKSIAMIKMAEEVNRLDVVFAQLTEQFNQEVSYRSNLLSSVLEPILIIFIGVMVGFILISMYLPLFELSTSVG